MAGTNVESMLSEKDAGPFCLQLNSEMTERNAECNNKTIGSEMNNEDEILKYSIQYDIVHSLQKFCLLISFK